MGLKSLFKRNKEKTEKKLHYTMISLQNKQDNLVNLKYTITMWRSEAVKCQKKDESEKFKAKHAIEKGNVGLARVHAENAIRQKQEHDLYLTMIDKLDSIVSRLEHLSSNKMKLNFIEDVANVIDKAVDCAIIKRNSYDVESDERPGVYCGSKINLTSKSVSVNDVDQFLTEIAQEVGVKLNLTITKRPETIKEETVSEMKETETILEDSPRSTDHEKEMPQIAGLEVRPSHIKEEGDENEAKKLLLDRGHNTSKSMSHLKHIDSSNLSTESSGSSKSSSHLEEHSKLDMTINEVVQDDEAFVHLSSHQMANLSSDDFKKSMLQEMESESEAGVTIHYPEIPVEDPCEQPDKKESDNASDMGKTGAASHTSKAGAASQTSKAGAASHTSKVGAASDIGSADETNASTGDINQQLQNPRKYETAEELEESVRQLLQLSEVNLDGNTTLQQIANEGQPTDTVNKSEITEDSG